MDEQKMMQMQVRTSSTYKQYGNVARTSTFQFYRKASSPYHSTAFYPFLFASVNSASFYRYPQFINFWPLLHQLPSFFSSHLSFFLDFFSPWLFSSLIFLLFDFLSFFSLFFSFFRWEWVWVVLLDLMLVSTGIIVYVHFFQKIFLFYSYYGFPIFSFVIKFVLSLYFLLENALSLSFPHTHAHSLSLTLPLLPLSLSHTHRCRVQTGERFIDHLKAWVDSGERRNETLRWKKSFKFFQKKWILVLIYFRKYLIPLQSSSLKFS